MTPTFRPSLGRFLAASAVALALPLHAAAHPGMEGDCGPGRPPMAGMPPHGMPGAMPPFLRALDLSEAQQDKVFAVMHAQAAQSYERMKLLHKAEADLRNLARAADYSEAAARSLADKLARAQADAILERVRSERQILEILTPEQREKLASMRPDDNPARGR